MLSFPIRNNLDAWKSFRTNEPDRTRSKKYKSLLEIVLEHNNHTLYSVFCEIRQCVNEVYENHDVQLRFIDMKDHSHANRIANYLDHLLFDAYHNDDKEECEALFDLSNDEIFVLLCSAQLHDYGKVRWQLAKFAMTDFFASKKRDSLPNDFYVEIYNNPHKEGITVESVLFEQIKSRISGISTAGDLESSGNLGLIEDCHTETIRCYLDAIIRGDNIAIEYVKSLIHDKEIRLINLLEQLRIIDVKYLEMMRDICSAHKPFRLFNPAPTDRLASISDKKTKLLAALLRLCDNLDMDKSRVAASTDRDLCELLVKYLSGGAPTQTIEEIAARYPKVTHAMSVWTKYLLVKGIEIAHRTAENGRRHLDIILNYSDFPSKDEYFFTLRYLTEKDFFSADFLKTIQDGHLNCKLDLKINLIYRIHPEMTRGTSEFIKLDNKSPIIQYFNEAKKDAQCRRTEQNYSTIFDCSEYFLPVDIDAIDTGKGKKRLLFLPNSLRTYYIFQTLRNKKLTKDIIMKLYKIDEPNCNSLLEKYCDEESQRYFLKQIDGLETLFKIASENPIVVKSKINELEICNQLFPFTRDSQPGLATGLPGLDEILSYGGIDQREIQHSRNIIVKGGPGTGKTTLALQIFFHNLNNTHRYVGKNLFYVTFDESPSRIEAECEFNFGWIINRGRIYHFPPSDDLVGDEISVAKKAENICTEFMGVVNRHHTDILFVDSLSRLRYCINDDKVYGEVVRRIFEKVEQQHLIAFYLLEDDDRSYEEYAGDGIIYLHSEMGLRYLEIRKLRNQGYASGKHAFTIINSLQIKQEETSGHLWLQTGINVFPNIRMYLDKGGPNIDPENLNEPVESGIEGLDNLLPIKPGISKGFLCGNVILVIGSPGCGKTIFGLHFIKKGIDKGEKGLWISFEGNRSDLKRTVHLFNNSLGFSSMLDEKNEDKFLFHYFPTTQFIPEELMYSIKKIVSDNRKQNNGRAIKRLVIDSVSEIEPIFEQHNAFKNFTTVLIQELRSMGITTVLLYRSAEFFGFQKQTKTTISSLVDTIISIKTFDIKNRIKKGLFVLKSRGREQFSNLQGMEILSDRGIVVSDKGWEMEGLLSGETGEIKEPHIFLKLFYENPAEEKINRHLIEDFSNRYRKDTSVFTCVQKAHIYSEFWSFKGNYGAGHANIRIVSLNKYMVEAFRESNRLHNLEGYFSSSLQNDIKSDTRWNKYINKNGHFDFLPSYSDFGVLVFQKHMLEETLYKDIIDDETIKKQLNLEEISWDNLIFYTTRICKLFKTISPERTCYPFAMPPLDNMSEFVAFFMEILWSYGGDIFSFPPFSDSLDRYGKNRLLFYKKLIFCNDLLRKEAVKTAAAYDINAFKMKIPLVSPDVQKTVGEYDINFSDENILRINDNDEDAIKAMTFLYDIIFEEKWCPNPALGDLRPHALTSRKWYSEVQEYRENILAVKDGKESNYIHNRVGVHQPLDRRQGSGPTKEKQIEEISLELHKLPFVDATNTSVTTQGIWCLSIIREALSPEIGWIFIDSIVSPAITRMRAIERLGFPIKIDDIESESYNRFDKDIYKRVASIMKNDVYLDDITDAKAKIRYLHTDKEDFIAAINKLKESDCNLSVLEPLIRKLEADLEVMQNTSKLRILIRSSEIERPQTIIEICDEAIFREGKYKGDIKDRINGYLVRRLFKKREVEWTEEINSGRHWDKLYEMLKNISMEYLQHFLDEETNKVKEKIGIINNMLLTLTNEPNDNQHNVQYCSKMSANRPYFYRIEPVLHKHLKRMFMSSDEDRARVSKEEFIKEILRDMRHDIVLEIFRNPS